VKYYVSCSIRPAVFLAGGWAEPVDEDSDTSKINPGNIERTGQIPIYCNAAKW
jgi:hypothetical protein